MIQWIKQNKLTALLIVIILVLLIPKSRIITLGGTNTVSTFRSSDAMMESVPSAIGGMAAKSIGIMPPSFDVAPQPGVTNRMVIRESNLSLLVKNVQGVTDQIIAIAETMGGYMVSSSVTNPQDAPTATVTVRIESDKLKTFLTALRGMAVKVVSENLSGSDVTDQYIDVDKRIAILEKTMTKYEEIMATAREISDITNLTNQIVNIQEQIDSLKGSQEALKNNAKLARVTIYLSTDELALPYAPSDTWRPEVIFKTAVRSLISELRKVAGAGIWLAVYSVIWIPILIIIYFVKKYLIKK